MAAKIGTKRSGRTGTAQLSTAELQKRVDNVRGRDVQKIKVELAKRT